MLTVQDLCTEKQLLKAQERVRHTFDYAMSRSVSDPSALVTAMLAYAEWNGRFAAGVSALAALVGASPNLFIDRTGVPFLNDRATYIASTIFEAARDEFDDRIQEHRDSHRCLAQACVMAMADYFKIPYDSLRRHGPWLDECNQKVLTGYLGGNPSVFHPSDLHANTTLETIFKGWGYHLGSELLADQEFSILDDQLRSKCPGLVDFMKRQTYTFAGGTHRGYAWIGIHSGHGGGVEEEHFNAALNGVNIALECLNPDQATRAVHALILGFRTFEKEHIAFFNQIPVIL
jgi:hypothetical protein